MDRTTWGVVGAISALVAFEGAQAAPIEPAQSFAELLAPIPNATARLKATNAAAKPPAAVPDTTQQLPMTRAGTPRPLPPRPTMTPRPTNTPAPKIKVTTGR